jgi:hypothetical protein
LVGGEHSEGGTLLTAVFVTILIRFGLGLRFLLQEDAIAWTTAGLILVPSWFLIIVFSCRSRWFALPGPARPGPPGLHHFFVLSFLVSLFAASQALGQVFLAH